MTFVLRRMAFASTEEEKALLLKIIKQSENYKNLGLLTRCCMHGSVEGINWIKEQGFPVEKKGAIEIASMCGQKDFIEWILQDVHGWIEPPPPPPRENLCHLLWLRDPRPPWE